MQLLTSSTVRFVLCSLAFVALSAQAEILDFSGNSSGDARVGIHSGAYKLTGNQGTPYIAPVFDVSGTSVTLNPATAPGNPTMYLVRDKPAWPGYRFFELLGADVGISWGGDPADRPADWKSELQIYAFSYMMTTRFTFTVGEIDQLTHIVLPQGASPLTLALLAPEGSILRVANIDVWPASPVPEPETYAMMLAGLCFIGFVARNKRSRVTSRLPA